MDVATGNAKNVTSNAAPTATVLSLANNGSGAIRVTTSAPHWFGNNDYVVMATTRAEATGTFQVTIVSATTFDLQGSTFAATGTGTAATLALTPQIVVPTDGDPASMQLSGMLSALGGILDRTQALALRGYAGAATFPTSGTWTCPPNVNAGVFVGCGGGGGGSETYQNTQSTLPVTVVPGAVGGAGAPLVVEPVVLVPGQTYTVTVGAGGAGSTVGGGGGADGSPTKVVSGFTVFEAPGGAGGGGGDLGTTTVSDNHYTAIGVCSPGGSGIATALPRRWPTVASIFSSTAGSNARNAIGHGVGDGGANGFEGNTGAGSPLNGGLAGMPGSLGPDLSAPGAPGTTGLTTNVSTEWAYGGFGGGGGGGGGGGPGGAGGNGGNGVANGTGSNGTAGTSAPAGSGGGGGGGGQGGAGSTQGTSGAGGNGGSGFLVLFYSTSTVYP